MTVKLDLTVSGASTRRLHQILKKISFKVEKMDKNGQKPALFWILTIRRVKTVRKSAKMSRKKLTTVKWMRLKSEL
jgi:hypothetical protein